MEGELDLQKVDEVALALLSLSRFQEKGRGPSVWKGLDWSITDRLHERGWITDPKGKARSVGLTEEGDRLAEAFLERYFRKSTD